MNARRITARVGICLAFLSFAASACDGGGAPRIKSFAASASNLPLPGGEVTLTWDVKGEKHLELRPFPGAVHGTGITLSVSESTDFTLVAKGNGRTDRETIHVGVGEPFAVAGRVLRPSYGPAAGFGVYVLGAAEPEPAFTDEVGNFRIEGVVAPYDLAVLDPALGSVVVVYQGLTRPDPTVVALFATQSFSTTVSGTVTGVPFPTPTPPPASQTLVHTYMPAGFRSAHAVNDLSGAWAANLFWGNSAEETVRITTLRWIAGPDGLPESFPGYDRTTEQVTHGVGLTVNPALTAVGAVSLSGSVTRDETLTTSAVFATVDYGTQPVPQSAPSILALIDVVDLPTGLLGTATTFQRFVPDVPASFALTAFGSNTVGTITHVRRNLAAGATGVTLDLPAPPRALLPVQNAVVSSSTEFSIASDDQSVNLFSFQLNGGTKQVYLFTASDSITFPDLTEIGIDPDSVFFGTVAYQSFGPYDSIDEATGSVAFLPTGDDSYIGYVFQGRSFNGPGSSN